LLTDEEKAAEQPKNETQDSADEETDGNEDALHVENGSCL